MRLENIGSMQQLIDKNRYNSILTHKINNAYFTEELPHFQLNKRVTTRFCVQCNQCTYIIGTTTNRGFLQITLGEGEHYLRIIHNIAFVVV